MAVGQQAVIANALKAGWQRMLQKTADKLFRRHSHDLLRLVRLTIVFPAERYITVFDSDDTAVGDRHTMRITAQILKHVFRAAKGRFGVDDPLFPRRRRQKAPERGRFGEH